MKAMRSWFSDVIDDFQYDTYLEELLNEVGPLDGKWLGGLQDVKISTGDKFYDDIIENLQISYFDEFENGVMMDFVECCFNSVVHRGATPQEAYSATKFYLNNVCNILKLEREGLPKTEYDKADDAFKAIERALDFDYLKAV